MTAVSGLSTNVALGAQATTHLTNKIDDVGKQTESISRTLQRVTADASASPAGRELLRRHADHDRRLDEHDEDIDSLRNWQNTVSTELRTTWRLMRGLAAAVSVIGTILGIVWTLHLLGVIP